MADNDQVQEHFHKMQKHLLDALQEHTAALRGIGVDVTPVVLIGGLTSELVSLVDKLTDMVQAREEDE